MPHNSLNFDFNMAFKSCPEAVCLTDLQDSTIIDLNEAFLGLLGYTRDELLGKKVTEIRGTWIRYEDRAIAIENLKKKGFLANFEREMLTKNNKKITVRTSAHIVQVLDRSYILTFFKNIDLQKLIDEKLRLQELILENMSEAVYLLKMSDLKIVYANRRAEKLFGYEPGEMMGKSMHDFNAPSNKTPEIIKYEILSALSQRESWSAEIEKVRKDGSRFWTYVSSAVFEHSEFGTVLISNLSDISEIKKAKKEKQEAEQLAAHATKLAVIGDLAAGVAHEISNPLTICLGMTELLKTEIEKHAEMDQAASLLERQNKALEKLIEISRSLRTLARKDSELPEVFSIRQAIMETLTLCQGIYASRGLEIDCEWFEDDIMVQGNSNKFQQVLMNLLSNAQDACKNNLRPGLFRIQIERFSDKTLLKFSDNGCGIAPDQMEKIFERYFTSKPPGQGTGLGLAIVDSIIKEMKGHVEVESQIGQGTCFKIILPKA